jgi:CRP/FNR family transcriptional regulator, cyclic AMP receptor protein
MSMLSTLDLIRRVPMFTKLSAPQAEFLAGVVVKRRFKKGERIVEQNHKSDALYIILSGRARVLMSDPKGREVILASLQMGDYIGEMSLIDNEVHSASVEAEVQTDTLELGRADFMRSLNESSSMAFAVMGGLVQRLRRADEKIGSLALMSVYDRVADVLLKMAKASPNHDMVIRDKVSRQDVAKMVGASREMVSRVMKDFEEQGFVEPLAGGGVRIVEQNARPNSFS